MAIERGGEYSASIRQMNIFEKPFFCRWCIAMKRYCLANPFPCAVLFVGMLLWIATPFVLDFSRKSPIVYHEGSIIEPAKVKAGDTVYITRHYDVTRYEPITILRRMEKGDCTNRCERIDLPNTEITNSVGVGFKSRRQMKLPDSLAPGEWTIRTHISWDDILGRRQAKEVPPLTVEIVP